MKKKINATTIYNTITTVLAVLEFQKESVNNILFTPYIPEAFFWAFIYMENLMTPCIRAHI